MSLNQIEQWVKLAARVELKNAKLRNKDLLAWRNAELKPEAGEIMIKVRALDMDWWVVVPESCDKRKK